jgi:hypothetical protein
VVITAVTPQIGGGRYTVEERIDALSTWQRRLRKKAEAAQDIVRELRIEAQLVQQAAVRASGEGARALTLTAAALADKALTNDQGLSKGLATLRSEDICPLDVESSDYRALWGELHHLRPGARDDVGLDRATMPAYASCLSKRIRTEHDFDYAR